MPFHLRLASLPVIAALSMVLPLGCRRHPGPSPSGPPRVVSLAPNLTEIICAIGAADLLVGRTTACHYPPDVVANIPAIGGFGTPSLEMLLHLKTTLVLEVDLENKALAGKLDDLGIPRKRIPFRTLDDIPSAIRTVGDLLDRRPAASALADAIQSRIAELRSLPVPANPPSVFIEIWSDPLMTVGKNSFVADLISLAGGVNIGNEMVSKEYFTVSSEWVVAKNPDVILCLTAPGQTPAGELVARRAGWSQIAAVRNGRIYESSHVDTLTLPGPRVLDGIDELLRFISGAATNAPVVAQ